MRKFWTPFLIPVMVFILAFAGVLPQPLISFTGITFVSSASQVNASVSGTFDSTGANLLVVSMSDFAGGTPGISDNKGNSWTTTANCAAGNASFDIAYSTPTTVGSGHTVTITNGGGFAPTGYVRAYSGAATSSVLDGHSCTCQTASTVSAGSITPANNGALGVTGFSFNQNYSSGPGGTGSFVDNGHNNSNLLAQMGAGIGTVIQTTAAAMNPSYTATSSTAQCVGVAAFDAPVATGFIRHRVAMSLF